ncbi:MAG: hypothetical protein J6Q84_00715 [Kiritimatiellae bacterium]|nr:hypothetical protein [Kiritimatiellia bacterium]
MKKLILVMFMISMGLIVRAEGGADTSFEELAIGELPIATDPYWSTNGVEGSIFEVFDVTATNGFESYEAVSHPEKYASLASNTKALSINTVDPIFRKVDSTEVDASGKPAISLKESPLYFDSIVQFETDYVSPEVGWRSDIQEYTDKIIVWLYASPSNVCVEAPGLFGETTPFTNIVITAGKYLNPGYNNMVSPTNYLTNIEVKPNEWHRLTIKAINNIAKAGEQHTPGFEIWLDQEKVEATLDYVNRDPSNMITTFPSMATRDFTGNNKITGVAFDGVGAVDDIVFTTAPTLEDIETYAITTSGENATIDLFEDEGANINIDKEAINVNIYEPFVVVFPDYGYELVSANFNGDSVQPCQIGEDYYIFKVTVPNSSGKVAKGATFGFTVEMQKKKAGAPMINGALAESPEAFIENANSGVTIEIPEGWTLNGNTLIDSNGDKYATFAPYYDVSLVDGIIELALNDTVRPVIGETASGKGDAIIVTDTAVIVGVTNARAGLYYGVQAYSEPAATAADKLGDASGWIKAEGETVNVTTDKPKDSNGEYIDPAFFRAVVTDVEPTP